jgi:hypothetical protein
MPVPKASIGFPHPRAERFGTLPLRHIHDRLPISENERIGRMPLLLTKGTGVKAVRHLSPPSRLAGYGHARDTFPALPAREG